MTSPLGSYDHTNWVDNRATAIWQSFFSPLGKSWNPSPLLDVNGVFSTEADGKAVFLSDLHITDWCDKFSWDHCVGGGQVQWFVTPRCGDNIDRLVEIVLHRPPLACGAPQHIADQSLLGTPKGTRHRTLHSIGAAERLSSGSKGHLVSVRTLKIGAASFSSDSWTLLATSADRAIAISMTSPL
jgi:hypothetical protein